MINPHRVAELLSNLVSEQLSLSDRNTTANNRDEEVAKVLYDQIESILESTHYSFETENTIDFNDDSNVEQSEEEEEDEDEEEEEIDDDDEERDGTFMEVDKGKENSFLNQFSVEYMRNAIDFYDAINEKTGKNNIHGNHSSTDFKMLKIEIILNGFENIWKIMEQNSKSLMQ